MTCLVSHNWPKPVRFSKDLDLRWKRTYAWETFGSEPGSRSLKVSWLIIGGIVSLLWAVVATWEIPPNALEGEERSWSNIKILFQVPILGSTEFYFIAMDLAWDCPWPWLSSFSIFLPQAFIPYFVTVDRGISGSFFFSLVINGKFLRFPLITFFLLHSRLFLHLGFFYLFQPWACLLNLPHSLDPKRHSEKLPTFFFFDYKSVWPTIRLKDILKMVGMFLLELLTCC